MNVTSTVPQSQLCVSGLQKSFKQRQVVNDVALEVNSGEVIGLLGPNGAGKTTSFYMIVGLIAADGGRITLDGQDITHRPIYERARLGLGYLPQEASIFRKMTVAQNINAILEISYPPEKRAEQLELLLADLHIEHIRNNTAISLSGGERRRAEIARVLAMNPRFILLDEPFAGVDPIALIDIQNLISFLKQRGIGTLIT
ncbi:MAG: LPS export ABC transporter ATP-binding protein, partial [Snodgrassella sp.]|nr:LPS export ABC transporter ATP-binding protein [Snodgrassella sp.]